MKTKPPLGKNVPSFSNEETTPNLRGGEVTAQRVTEGEMKIGPAIRRKEKRGLSGRQGISKKLDNTQENGPRKRRSKMVA